MRVEEYLDRVPFSELRPSVHHLSDLHPQEDCGCATTLGPCLGLAGSPIARFVIHPKHDPVDPSFHPLHDCFQLLDKQDSHAVLAIRGCTGTCV